MSQEPETVQPSLCILVASEVRVYRETLAHLLACGAFHFKASATDGQQLVETARRVRPHAVLIDMAMEDSFGVVQALVRELPGIRIVAFGVAHDESDVVSYAAVGVSGYVGRSASVDELLDAVRSAAEGRGTCSPRAGAVLLEQISAFAPQVLRRAGYPNLTRREHQIVQLIERGLSNKEIARHLCIEVATVKNHVHSILEKLHVSRRTDAAEWVRSSSPS